MGEGEGDWASVGVGAVTVAGGWVVGVADGGAAAAGEGGLDVKAMAAATGGFALAGGLIVHPTNADSMSDITNAARPV